MELFSYHASVAQVSINPFLNFLYFIFLVFSLIFSFRVLIHNQRLILLSLIFKRWQSPLGKIRQGSRAVKFWKKVV